MASETQRPEPVAVELPALRNVLPAAGSAQIGRSGGAVVAGAARVDIPPDALEEPIVVDIELLDAPEALGRELPGSLALAVLRAGPWNIPLTRAARITVPLSRDIPAGTPVELLSWHPQMRAFVVSGISRASEDGTATFPVRMLGEMLVRGVPVTPPAALVACDGPNFSMRQTWPTRSEDDAAGLTPIDDRMPRDVAFSLLSDFRLAPAFAGVDFKNEEVVNTGAFRADQRNHQDEDFLMDPNAAAALTALVALVEREWRDPFTGEPAVRVRVTEAYDSLIEHSSTSTHYQGRALDLTTSPVPAADGPTRRHWYGRLSRLAVCAGFDWVFFENAAHVHASVVPTEVALVAEADGELRVQTGSLLTPRRLRPTDRRLTSTSGTPDTLRWDASGAFELLSSAARLVEGSGDAGTSDVAFTSVDGLRQIVIRDGRAYLVNTSPLPPLGSIDAEGRPVDVEYPVPLSPPGAYIRAASFREHAPTRQALERLATEAPASDAAPHEEGSAL